MTHGQVTDIIGVGDVYDHNLQPINSSARRWNENSLFGISLLPPVNLQPPE